MRDLGGGIPGPGGPTTGTPPPPPPSFPPPPPPPPVVAVALSGTVTFDAVPHSTVPGAGLDFAAARAVAARGITVEAIDVATGAVIASAQTDANGFYSVTVPARSSMFLRAKAEMTGTGIASWIVRVRDNTAANALHRYDGPVFDSGDQPTLDRDLHAASGWDLPTQTYPDPSLRDAAPFAILDAIRQAQELVLSADSAATFPPLDVYWSPLNHPQGSGIAPASGDIGATHFERPAPGDLPWTEAAPAKIYVLGEENVDTDEFDPHVVLREWAHYYQVAFSRDDTIGGPHGLRDRLDLRLAFSEGWAIAMSGMALGNPEYRNSVGAGQGGEHPESLSLDTPLASRPGWFSAEAIALVVYNLFDADNGGIDAVQLGFRPLHEAMTNEVRTANAFTSIYPLVNGLLTRERDSAVVIRDLVRENRIHPVQPDSFAEDETYADNGTNTPTLPMPIYRVLRLSSDEPADNRDVCTHASSTEYFNKVWNRRFLRLVLREAGSVRIVVQPAPGAAAGSPPITDPQLRVYTQGSLRGEALLPGNPDIVVADLAAGSHVIEVYDASSMNDVAPRADACLRVRVFLQ